jgi:hypothetical protein
MHRFLIGYAMAYNRRHHRYGHLFQTGGGLEYRQGEWGGSIDVKLRYLGEPDSALGDPSEADPSWTIPIVFGINYYF